jgi:hypothetical protein
MNPHERLRRTFVCFHIVLGVGLLIGSVQTVLSMGHRDPHAPRTLRVGAVILLSVFAVAFPYSPVPG